MLRESHRSGIEPATCKSQVQCPAAEPPLKHVCDTTTKAGSNKIVCPVQSSALSFYFLCLWTVVLEMNEVIIYNYEAWEVS